MLRALCIGIAVIGISGQARSARASDAAGAAATVSNAVPEKDLATVKLAPEAEQRLGIAVVPLARRSVEAVRTLAGEVIPALGNGASNAPVALAVPSTGADALLALSERQTQADVALAQAKAELDLARSALRRAQQMRADRAASPRELEEARARADVASAAHEAAKGRRALLGASIDAAMRSGRVWLRVPVAPGELALLDATRPVKIGDATAWPVRGPRSADAASATVDLFYELARSSLRVGERVPVDVPLAGTEDRLVAPRAAILWDVHGNTWVYEQTAPGSYVRRRVQLLRVVGDDALLASGPAPGARIVTDGAAELFGTELGTGK